MSDRQQDSANETWFESTIGFVKERLGNPILGSLTTFLLIVNWRAVILFLSSNDYPNDKIRALESYFQEYGLTNFIIAIALSCVHLLIVPIVSHFYLADRLPMI